MPSTLTEMQSDPKIRAQQRILRDAGHPVPTDAWETRAHQTEAYLDLIDGLACPDTGEGELARLSQRRRTLSALYSAYRDAGDRSAEVYRHPQQRQRSPAVEIIRRDRRQETDQC